MKKLTVLIITAILMLSCGIFMAFDAGAEAEIIYVKAGGTGNGSSESSAFGSITDAMNAAATRTGDVDIVIVGVVDYNFSAHYTEPDRTNKVTIRGKDDSAKLKCATNAKVWRMGGELEIRDLAVEITKNSQFTITTRFYPLTFGEGVVVTNTSGTAETKGLFSVRAVDSETTRFYNSSTKKYTADSTIVLKSGRFEDISAFAHNGSKGSLNGTCRLYVGPDVEVNNLTVCRNAKYTATNADIYIDGATIRRHAAVCDGSVSGLGTSLSGVTGDFKFVITKNTNISNGWNHASPASTLFQGLSGCSASKDDAETHLGRANFVLEIEEGVYDATVANAKVRIATFDEVKKIADGTGVPADILGGGSSDDTTEPPATDAPDTDAPDTDAPDTDAPGGDTPDTPEFDGETIYVKAGGTGDGSSEENAFGSITDAVDAAADKDKEVRVVIVGTVDFDFSAAYSEPTRKHKLTIMGKDSSAKLRVKTSGKVWTIGGEFEIRELNIEITKNSSLVFTTQFYHTTFGEGLKVTNTSGVKDPKSISVRTVDSNVTRNYDSAKKLYSGTSTIVIKSGTYEDVSAFAHNGAKGSLDGTCRLYVGSDATVNNLTVSRNVYATATNAEIYLDGAVIRRFMAVTDRNISTLTEKVSGVSGSLRVVVTKNTDISLGWDHSSIVESYFHGLSGCSPSKDNAESHLDRADFILEIEESVYDATVACDRVRTSTFDSIKKIADGAGVPADIFTGEPAEEAPDTPVFEGETIYVKAGGTGDGSSEDEAFGSITDAVNAAAKKNKEVRVVIVGTVDFDFSESYKEPARKYKLTIMGKDSSAKLRVKTSGKVWTIGGEFEMRELNIEITKNSSFVFTTQFYYTTFGEGLNVTNTSGAKEPKSISVRTVDSNTTRKYNSKKKCYIGRSTIILKSGMFEDVCAFAHNGAKGNLSGTCKVYIGPDAVVNNLTVSRNVNKTATNAEIIIDGGVVRRFMAVTDRNISTLGTKKSGVTGTFKVVITKNTDINAGWNHTNIVETYFHGLSGCSPSKDNAESHLGRANYILEIEESVYDAVTESAKVRLSTFDSVVKIEDGTGVPETLFDAALNPDTSDDITAMIAAAAIMLVSLTAGVLLICKKKKATN